MGKTTQGQGFTAWIKSLIAQPLYKLNPGDVARAVKEMLGAGIVHTADISTRNAVRVAGLLQGSGLFFTCFSEAIFFSPPKRKQIFIPKWKDAEGLTDGVLAAAGHALYTTHPDTLRRAKAEDQALGLPFSLHLAEHQEEVDMLRDGSGPLPAMLKKAHIGLKHFTPPGVSPVARARDLGLLDQDTLAVHCVQLTGEDMDILARTRTNVCCCPRSNDYIGVGHAPWEELMARGCEPLPGHGRAVLQPRPEPVERGPVRARAHQDRIHPGDRPGLDDRQPGQGPEAGPAGRPGAGQGGALVRGAGERTERVFIDPHETESPMQWRHKDLLDVDQLTREEVASLFETAVHFQEINSRPVKKVPTLRGRSVVLFFAEPSTRTKTSFDVAGKRLSADTFSLAKSGSSLAKGETLKDTALTLQAMNPDAIVIRHSCSGSARFLAERLDCSIINAGDGRHAHPTQALLDACTLTQQWGNLKGKTLLILGDISHSRVARSNVHLLTLLGARVRLCAPRTLLPANMDGWPVEVFSSLDKAVRGVDAIMCLRLQLERMQAGLLPDLREYARTYGLNARHVAKAAPGCAHPAPRAHEPGR